MIVKIQPVFISVLFATDTYHQVFICILYRLIYYCRFSAVFCIALLSKETLNSPEKLIKTLGRFNNHHGLYDVHWEMFPVTSHKSGH